MAVIQEEDYNKSLAKIEKKKRDKLVEFLQSMPYFKSFTKLALNKLVNSFNLTKYYKGQTVLHEGVKETTEGSICFIIKGEFAATQTISVENQGQDVYHCEK